MTAGGPLMIELSVHPDLLWAVHEQGLDTVGGAFTYASGRDLVKGNLGHRRRTAITVTDKHGRSHDLFLKRYEPEPLWQRLKRIWTYGRGWSPSSIEAGNIWHCSEAGIATMGLAASGAVKMGLGGWRSFIIVTKVPGEALSRCIDGFLARHVSDGGADRLATQLARLAAKMHAAGLVHRDFYTAHVFLEESDGAEKLWLIDLARMFRPRAFRAFRWQVKDLAALKFSLPEAFAATHWEAILREYVSLRRDGEDMLARLRRAVDRKVRWMVARHRRKETDHHKGHQENTK